MSVFDFARINRITVVSNQGIKQYAIGDRVNGKTIDSIVLQALDIGEETIHYYCGIATTHSEPLVFSVAVNCPHEIEYE